MSLADLEDDPRLFLYTSLTAGSSHIISATSRMETILKANKVPFQAIDTATDERARRLWQRRSHGKKLPGLVKQGMVLGDLEDIEEWNEFGELKENIGDVPTNYVPPAGGQTGVNIAPPIPVNPTATGGTAKISQQPPGGVNKAPAPGVDESKMRALPGAAEIAARNKPQASSIDSPPRVESMTSAPDQKEQSVSTAASKLKADDRNIEHLSAPASALQSGTATPAPELATSSVDAPEEGDGGKAETHSGSEVKEAESKSTLPEETAEGDKDASEVAKKVEAMQVGDGKTVQEQPAAEAADATKSVED